MNNIKFNYCIPREYRKDNKQLFALVAGNEKMPVDYIENIYNLVNDSMPKSGLPWIQFFDCGYRIQKDNLAWKQWTGCCYVDLDTKRYYNEVKKFDVELLFKTLYDYLIFNYTSNFYFMQISNSGTSAHIVFYFDVEKTEENFNKCSYYAIDIIKDAFHSMGEDATKIINYKGVIDSCAKSPFQGMYLTKNKIIFNELIDNWFGNWEWIDNYEVKDNKVVKVDKVKEKVIDFLGFEYNDKKIEVKYYEHIVRWQIYNSLIPCFTSKEEVDEAWQNKIVPYLKEGNGHNKSFYKQEPTRNRWFERYDTQYVDEKFIEPFGFKFEKRFVPKKVELYKYDEIIRLNKDERLSDIDLPLKRNKINHIFAGCGVGKTYMSKMLGTNVDELDFIFQGQKRICVVVPLKSISKNSFDGVDNWFCIDGDMDESIKKNILENPYKNICTTWESFTLYEMHKINFEYVIVDEIHTLYMYDYRVDSITHFKNVIKNCNATYTIFMTGTPSYETVEFDCFKIKIEKEDVKVPCQIVVYNDSYMGWIFNDIQEWIKDENHYALIFKDTTNYKIIDDAICYGFDIDIFNKQYTETTNYILTNENVRKQITAFSVYGQAGINIYIDTDKKVRIYIANDNGLGIIQYANRVRNKNTIDKIVTFSKKIKVDADVNKINELIDIDDAKRRVKVLSSIKKEHDIFKVDSESFMKLHYGFNKACVDWGIMELNEPNYTNYKIIQNVMEYEKQLQIIYNRLTEAYFDVEFIYLKEDIKTLRDTKMRSNQFAGQMIRFDLDMIKVDHNDRIRLEVTESFNKIVTGTLIEDLQNILNVLYVDNDRNFDNLKSEFKSLIELIITNKGTIKKADITHLNTFYNLRNNWNKFYDKVFIKIMMDENWDTKKIASVYMRTIYNEQMTTQDWKSLLEESYQKISHIRNIVKENRQVFEQLEKEVPVSNMTFNNDILLQKFYTYLTNKHTIGKQSKNQKKCVVKGKEFNSQKEAMEYFKVSKTTIIKWIKSGK